MAKRKKKQSQHPSQGAKTIQAATFALATNWYKGLPLAQCGVNIGEAIEYTVLQTANGVFVGQQAQQAQEAQRERDAESASN